MKKIAGEVSFFEIASPKFFSSTLSQTHAEASWREGGEKEGNTHRDIPQNSRVRCRSLHEGRDEIKAELQFPLCVCIFYSAEHFYKYGFFKNALYYGKQIVGGNLI